MKNNTNKLKIAAIIPAYNEGATIANVLKILLTAEELDEIIVVSSGSTDDTAKISESLGAKVIDSQKRAGKAEAMKEGLDATTAGIIAFFDADLVGLTKEHVSQLVQPVLEAKASMVVGIRDRIGETPLFILKIDPLSAFGGERALERSIFENIPQKFRHGFAIETAMNCYCQVNNIPVKYVKLKELKMIIKERKYGFLKGFLERIQMMWTMFKIRISVLLHRKEFKRPS